MLFKKGNDRMSINYIEEKIKINEESIEYAVDMLSIPINHCFKTKNSVIKVNNEIFTNKDIPRIIALFNKDKYLSIKVNEKIAIFFFKNNYIIKRSQDENNYKIFIKESEEEKNNYIN